jgi:hypothetical protein
VVLGSIFIFAPDNRGHQKIAVVSIQARSTLALLNHRIHKHKRAVFVTARCRFRLLRLFVFVDFDHFAALVMPAVRADAVRQAHRSAVAAGYQVARGQGVVGPATVAASLRVLAFWLWGHDFLLLIPQLFRCGKSMKMPGMSPAVNFQTIFAILAGEL